MGQDEIVLNFPTRAVAWHPWKDSLLCIGMSNGRLALWDAILKKPTAIFSDPESTSSFADCLTWSPLTGELVVSV